MTIGNETSEAQFTGAPPQVAFPFTFWFHANADVAVYSDEALQVEGVDYTLTGAQTGAGTVTYTTAPLSGVIVTVVLEPLMLQGADYPANDPFPSATHELALDRTVTQNKAQKGELLRAVKIAIEDPTPTSPYLLPNIATRASKFLAFDASGDAIASSGLDSTALVISTFAETLLDDTTALAMRTTLIAPGLTDANIFTKTQTWTHGADVASAAALPLGDGNAFDITGTTTITSIDTLGVGTVVILQFDAALILTHHATDLILPTGANITTAAGDFAVFEEYATGDWRCVMYSRANGLALEDTIDIQSFDASGTWTKPSFGTTVIVEAWGAGGGGGIANGTEGSGGGGGGTYVWYAIPVADLGATETVTIGAGGTAGAHSTLTHGGTGGSSTFGSFVTAFGGGGGTGAGLRGGGGGGSPGGAGTQVASGGLAGLWGAQTAGVSSYFGGAGDDSLAPGGEAGIGGGGGGSGSSVADAAGAGGASKIGGGGGGGSSISGTVGAGGVSGLGGNGGAGASDTTAAVAGVQPGGGGGAGAGTGGSSAAAIGGAGRIRVTVI